MNASSKTAHGACHWLLERLLGLVLVPLSLWFVWSVLRLTHATRDEVISWVQNPLHAIPLALFITVGFWHGAMGLQVVIDDYVTCKCKRMALTILVKLAAVLFVVSTLYAIFLMSSAGGVQ